MPLLNLAFVLLHNIQLYAALWNILKPRTVSKEQFCAYKTKEKSLLKLQTASALFWLILGVHQDVSLWLCRFDLFLKNFL